LNREDFIFTIGYHGTSAIVDADAKRRYGKLSVLELAEKGLYRAAFCSALCSESTDEMREFLGFFNGINGEKQYSAESLKRLFGVYQMPSDIQKTTQIKKG
jgi:hypothetical protein